MSPALVRIVLRWSHITLGVLVGAYLYSPLHGSPLAAEIIKWLVVPSLVVTGVAIWKQGRWMRFFTTRERR